MKLLFAMLVMSSSAIAAPTLLFTNKVPAETTTPEYYAGVQAITDAIAMGYRVHASILLPENGGTAVFYSNIVDIKVSVSPSGPNIGQPYYVSGILDMRPHINNMAQAIGPSPLTSGSLDSYGVYWYNGVQQPGYAISWWAD